jgi:CBS domain-containing protein/anti-sigma regulatory factor (Ser/Thr protein kinase)
MKRKGRPQPKIQKTHELSYALKISEAMNRRVITLKPDHSMEDVRRILRTRQISGVPIVESKRLIGIVSIEDLINCLTVGCMEKPIRDVMTERVAVLYSDEPLIHAIHKFDREGFGRFPVLDRESGTLVGIITKKDTIQCLLKALETSYHKRERKEDPRFRATHLFKDLPSDGTALRLTYHVEAGNFKKAGERSDQLKENLLKLGYSDDSIRRLIIAVLEAEMNVVIFTSGGDIIAFIEPDKITIHVTDQGPGIPDIELAMQPGYSTAPDFIRELGFGAGMGLPNIKNCTDEMRIESQVGKGTDLQFAIYP